MPCKIDFEKDWELKYQGAESKLYYGIHSNTSCVIKHRFSKKYRHPVLDKKLTKERTKRERRMIEKLKSKSNLLSHYMPSVIWSDDSTLLMTEIKNCQTLLNYIEENDNNQNLKDVAILVGRCIAELHNLGIIHGDLTTANLLLVSTPSDGNPTDFKQSDRMIVPIDFGLSTGSFHPEERAVDLYVLERAMLSTHSSGSEFFDQILSTYVEYLEDSKCTNTNDHKVLERLKEVRARGRKAEYTGE